MIEVILIFMTPNVYTVGSLKANVQFINNLEVDILNNEPIDLDDEMYNVIYYNTINNVIYIMAEHTHDQVMFDELNQFRTKS